MPKTGVTAPSLLSSLQDYYARHGVLPSYAAMGELAGIRAKSWVFTLVGQLKEAGFLDVTPENRLKPGPRFFERNVAASVRAGQPEDPPDTPLESISIDRYLIDQPSKAQQRVVARPLALGSVEDELVGELEQRQLAFDGVVQVQIAALTQRHR